MSIVRDAFFADEPMLLDGFSNESGSAKSTVSTAMTTPNGSTPSVSESILDERKKAYFEAETDL